jgi:tRNA pseudouridine13 synthase
LGVVDLPALKPTATIRRTPEDFRVDEIPAFDPAGEGEHLFLRITKTNVTTPDALKQICRALDVDERGAGSAGMKDKRAITTQQVSLPFPRTRSPEEALALTLDGVRVDSAVRHGHKLKPGHLKGNRFSIVLRDLPEQAVDAVLTELRDAEHQGVPNSFGPQRFGRDGDNSERALTWLTGKSRGPQDRRERRLLFSALQSDFYNRVLARRVELGSWNRPLAGDLLKKTDTGGMFLCAEPQVDGERAARREVSPTGPMFGAKMTWPEGEPAAIEREVLGVAEGGTSPFDAHPELGEGTRRALVLFARDVSAARLPDSPGAVRVEFVLPKGGYATTFLACAVVLQEQTGMR